MKQDHLNNYRLRVVPSRLSRVRWFSLELTFRSLYYSWGKMGTRTTTDWCRDCDKSITDTLDTTKVACAKGILENLSRGMRMAEWKMSLPLHVLKRSAASVVLTENNLKTAHFRADIYLSYFSRFDQKSVFKFIRTCLSGKYFLRCPLIQISPFT